MGEFFEITFFSDRTANCVHIAKEIMGALHIGHKKTIMNTSPFQLLLNKELHFQMLEKPSYTEYQLSIMDMVFTERYFDTQLDQMLQVVTACFACSAKLLFATGIYELTDYFLKEADSIGDILANGFPKYPFLFFREDRNQYGYTATKSNYGVSCVVQFGKDIQRIFPTQA